jgi:hypothetical protein
MPTAAVLWLDHIAIRAVLRLDHMAIKAVRWLNRMPIGPVRWLYAIHAPPDDERGGAGVLVVFNPYLVGASA